MKVKITAKCMVEFSQIVEMSEDKFKSYEDACERDEEDGWFNEFAEQYIDTSDICDADEFEDVNVKRYEPKMPHDVKGKTE